MGEGVGRRNISASFFCSNSRGFALFITNKRRNAKDLRWVLFQALFPFFSFSQPWMPRTNKWQWNAWHINTNSNVEVFDLFLLPDPIFKHERAKNMLFCPCRLAWHWQQLFDTSLFILTYYTKGLKATSLCFMCNKQDISDLFPL